MDTMQLSTLLYNFGKFFGIIGFACLSFLIFSGDTARFWDRFFGLDKIIKFQRKFSLVVAFFILFHPIFFILSTKSISNYLIPDFSVLPLALGIVAGYLFIIVMISSSIYKRVSYTIWQYIHILIYLLFFFALYHASNWGSDSSNIYLKTLYATSLILIVVGATYRTQYKIRKRFSGKFFVKNIQRETEDTFILTIEPEKKLNFKAGQFCFLRLNKNELYARHPFTISSSPDEYNLQFAIKDTGRFTKTASELKNTEEILIDGPFGKFIKQDKKKDLVFIAGGVGITPFMSMIRDCLKHEGTQNVTLIYCSKTEDNIIFKNELDSIHKNWFKKIYILSQNKKLPVADYIENGYITKTIIEKYVENIDEALYYICGPELMKENTKRILKDLKINKKNILVEDFFW